MPSRGFWKSWRSEPMGQGLVLTGYAKISRLWSTKQYGPTTGIQVHCDWCDAVMGIRSRKNDSYLMPSTRVLGKQPQCTAWVCSPNPLDLPSHLVLLCSSNRYNTDPEQQLTGSVHGVCEMHLCWWSFHVCSTGESSGKLCITQDPWNTV